MSTSDCVSARPESGPAGTQLTVRQLLVDLRTPLQARWHRNDFLTQYFNALSMSFPVGEQFFIDSVRGALPLLPQAPQHELLRADIVQFIGQEAAHRHIHAQYNAHLQAQGLVNHWERWARWRIGWAQRRGLKPLALLAITCAYEHLTATLADVALRYGDSFDGAEPRMRSLWLWHASEEVEHRSVAFDLYVAAGGSPARRVRWYLYILLMMALEAGSQTALNLHHSGRLWRLSTWRDGLSFLLGPRGLLWRIAPALWRYLRRDFHPSQEGRASAQAADLARQWLSAHPQAWRSIR